MTSHYKPFTKNLSTRYYREKWTDDKKYHENDSPCYPDGESNLPLHYMDPQDGNDWYGPSSINFLYNYEDPSNIGKLLLQKWGQINPNKSNLNLSRSFHSLGNPQVKIYKHGLGYNKTIHCHEGTLDTVYQVPFNIKSNKYDHNHDDEHYYYHNMNHTSTHNKHELWKQGYNTVIYETSDEEEHNNIGTKNINKENFNPFFKALGRLNKERIDDNHHHGVDSKSFQIAGFTEGILRDPMELSKELQKLILDVPKDILIKMHVHKVHKDHSRMITTFMKQNTAVVAQEETSKSSLKPTLTNQLIQTMSHTMNNRFVTSSEGLHHPNLKSGIQTRDQDYSNTFQTACDYETKPPRTLTISVQSWKPTELLRKRMGLVGVNEKCASSINIHTNIVSIQKKRVKGGSTEDYFFHKNVLGSLETRNMKGYPWMNGECEKLEENVINDKSHKVVNEKKKIRKCDNFEKCDNDGSIDRKFREEIVDMSDHNRLIMNKLMNKRSKIKYVSKKARRRRQTC